MDQAITTDDYKSFNAANKRINERALKDFHKLHGYFSPNNCDVILDFGCGTGETTAGMARGELVHEKPSQVFEKKIYFANKSLTLIFVMICVANQLIFLHY